ncbi:hypothetical protein FQ087_17305 [Sporosarcina sp. ANT_H38]|uniref:hypothetical protein n=1 Tax=Sporosarcina sp. ANT_H38 TaxID=2597358 RepID=UPI0011F1D5F6|nr:hypothetical protein [Sporosarcina sp. ANT_H38]KAA0948747.1 hypothetical protein FQ087_17305 [Sporosarcina sp. ANT_H38]
MEVWKGLLRKEWALMKWRLIIFVLITSAIQYLGVNRLVYGLPEDFYASIQPIIALCFMLHLAMAISLLFDGLGKEMGRPDIWLHSPASILQLVFAKISLIVITIGCSLFLCGTIAGIYNYARDGAVPVVDDLILFLGVGVVILLNAIYVMAVVFFFWSIYQVFRSRIGWFSIVVVIALVNMWIIGWELVWSMEMVHLVTEIGPMHGSIKTVDILMLSNYIVPGGSILTIGSLVLYGMMTVLYLVVGSILFEKKVRL